MKETCDEHTANELNIHTLVLIVLPSVDSLLSTQILCSSIKMEPLTIANSLQQKQQWPVAGVRSRRMSQSRRNCISLLNYFSRFFCGHCSSVRRCGCKANKNTATRDKNQKHNDMTALQLPNIKYVNPKLRRWRRSREKCRDSQLGAIKREHF